ncbi:MAG: hypothetical protein JKY19_07255 [Alcanivoracaceae bacterium]|nr:hypothetical protein [Alcanivoracaceae bacterium]
MSESEVDNSQKQVIESEIIAAEIDKNPPSEAEDTNTQHKVEPVVVKKGSFFTFITFLLSISALAVSGYLFYLQQYTKPAENNTQPWQKPLAAIDNKLTQQLVGFSQQLTSIKLSNEQLILQLESLQKKAQTPVSSVKKFDDTSIKQQILSIETQLHTQNSRLSELQNNLSTTNQHQKQSIQQLMENIQSNQTTPTDINPQEKQNNYSYAMAESLLQAAHIQLNVNGNIVKTQDLLNKAQEQLQQLSTKEYANLANELQTVSSALSHRGSIDTVQLNKQIDETSVATAQLKFSQDTATINNKQESSWYDKLITIRKIDNNQQSMLSKDEQSTILQTFKSHYHMLKIALMSNNQTLWLDEIAQIENLLQLHFTENSKNIMLQLATLKAIDINPVFPDLSTYLQKLKSINTENNESH